MSLRKNILFIASWLDLEKGIGSFFTEQAFILNKKYNISIVHFSSYKPNWITVLKGNLIKIEKKLYENQVEVYFVEYPSIKFIKNFLCNRAIKKLFDWFRNENKYFEICHAHSIFDAGFWANRINEKYSIPFIITEHNQLTFKRVKRKKLKYINQLLENADKRVVVSNDLVRQFASNGYFLDFEVIGNTFNQIIFNIDNRVESSNIKIVTQGAYTPIKDYETLLKALKIVENSTSKVIEFIWIGYNSWGVDMSDEVKELINSFDFKNINIQLYDSLNKIGIATMYKQSTFFVSSSICETFGLSVVEAMACGLPVVVTQSGGVNDFVNDSNGIIVPIKNEYLLAQAILELMNNQLKYNSKLISEDVVAKFGEKRFIEKYSFIYDSIK
ncbi:MAG TPA: glycosyltransferase family 4 protein [Flavobacterium sp.]|nr:glycosyltransferase family 4 protein [Flavobacterium sp.]